MKPRTPEGAEDFFSRERPAGLHERVHKSLLHAILSGRFPTGARLPPEPELAAAFGVSRPVLRQALEKLRAEDLILSRQGSGNMVADLGGILEARLRSGADLLRHAEEMRADLEFRSALEPEAARLAALRRGDEDLERLDRAMAEFREACAQGLAAHHADYLFHEAIARASGNPRFLEAAQALEYAQEGDRLLMRRATHFHPSALAAEALEEHLRVLEAIRQGESAAAFAAMKAHLEASLARHQGALERLKAGKTERDA